MSLSPTIARLCGASDAEFVAQLQSLWSGYGAIERWALDGGTRSVIVKRIAPPDAVAHPRGWHSSLSHRRKLKSYQVESHWYQHQARNLADDTKVPRCLGIDHAEGQTLLLLEDLDALGFDLRVSEPSSAQMALCIQWLARFHARFLGQASEALWDKGTYWHLDTRPEEWAVMTDSRLQAAAASIDNALHGAQYRTLVHGDAKLANFCFGKQAVAAVDFQYVGGGVGVQDLAYFLGSVLDEAALLEQGSNWLTHYFQALGQALLEHGFSEAQCQSVEAEWRRLYPVAVADFARFLNGWAPDHWKVNRYTEGMTSKALSLL
ncbi:phosphotransferase [Ferrimonas marina]|uniref:Ecdysteroid kinase n=1 Tax=Ferrimonas marina TaxID=299255 RepID=A0A1M5ZQ53_9GAMM|nr:phosphotransferase [Ferrimonas marina]SHI26342.1 Ecdysteroid kinase [Ferrimonas marina]